MSKQVMTLGELTEAQVKQVKAVISDMAGSKYSTSKIYASHNLVFDKSETPESCASCLKRRATALRDWFNDQEAPKASDLKVVQGDATPIIEAVSVKTKAGEDLAASVSKDAEGNYVGISDEEGKALKPGTYTLENGDAVAVQPGGKSTYKPNEDLT